MFSRVAMPNHDEDSTSMTSHESRWMSHWINGSAKPGTTIDNSSLICYERENLDSKACLNQTRLKMEDGLPYGKGIRNFPFPSLTLGRNKEKVSTIGSLGDHILDEKPGPLALALCNGVPSKPKSIVGSGPCKTYNKSNGKEPVVVFERHFSNDNFTCFSQEGCKYQKSSSVLFHEKKTQNDHDSPEKKNFESFFLKKKSQNVPCSFRNVETMRICTMVDSVENSPGDFPKVSQRAHHILFTKETCVNMSKGHQNENIFDGSFNTSSGFAPRSRGVKIQPLWTSTDSEEKETNGNPSICKNVLRNEGSTESDGMQIELSLGHQNGKKFGGSFRLDFDVGSRSKGVDIEPFRAFTNSEEKENIGNSFTSKSGSRYETSAETNEMRVEASKNRHISLGTDLSPLTKQHVTMNDNTPPTACDSSTTKARSKRPINEIPDINEEFSGIQPAISSTGGKEPSTSRVHSLNAKQLFSSNEETSKPKCGVHSDHPDADSRWIKRLKLNSCDSFGVGTKSSDGGGDLSSHDKFGIFFNRITKNNRETYDVNHHEKEDMVIDRNVNMGSVKCVGPAISVSKKRNRSMMAGCSWIQRWCQSCRDSPPNNPEPLVICEPHSLKNGQEEITKKQFPSIGAMALMGKAMNGFPSCEFKKRGPVVVWNTKEY